MREERLGLPIGTIKATVLIETLPAAFEMDEILYEMRDHIVGPELRPLGLHLLLHQDARQEPALPAAGPRQVVMGKAFLNAYSLL